MNAGNKCYSPVAQCAADYCSFHTCSTMCAITVHTVRGNRVLGAVTADNLRGNRALRMVTSHDVRGNLGL